MFLFPVFLFLCTILVQEVRKIPKLNPVSVSVRPAAAAAAAVVEDVPVSHREDARRHGWVGSSDLYSLNPGEQESFFAHKEALYLERKERIDRVCKRLGEIPGGKALLKARSKADFKVWQFVPKYKVAYCYVTKVFKNVNQSKKLNAWSIR